MLFPMYRVAQVSGHHRVGIDDLKIAKKAWIYSDQSYSIIYLTQVNYTFKVQAMSAEKLPFVLPVVFTIGPRAESIEAVQKFARLLASCDKKSKHVEELVQGIIEGETRVLVASMTMEVVFKGIKEFKKEVFDKVQLELNQFRLFIYNANVKQLVDVKGHEYFSYLGQRVKSAA